MKFKDLVSRVFIDPRKLTTYALNPQSLRGRDKALMFQQCLGFTLDNHQLLLEQVQEKAMDAEAIPGTLDEHGQRYRADLLIAGIKAWQQEIVRTGWIIEPKDKDLAKLTTIFIRRRK
ncbi:MAG: hypothetical protein HC929_05290 [Leptolyngbyaceae cyanobacterium SM2_5_2]|nr:hypothetical protein [Leptolyngbyaceae cyanobacterium SM2_5_2]